MGVDALADTIIHKIVKLEVGNRLIGKEFILGKINEILATNLWPRYLGTSKLIPLSKTEDEYPPIDKIRTIAVMPAISKLLELCMLVRLEPICFKNEGLIHRC